jgi:hypothetical protein
MARGLHPADALACTHRQHGEEYQCQVYSTEPERDSLTPPQARGLLTRARIRAPFDSEKTSLTQGNPTIDNVKAKIDNVKTKIQDEED